MRSVTYVPVPVTAVALHQLLGTRCAAGRGKQRSSKGGQLKGSSSQALNKMLKYLLPIAGKRIAVLFALAIVRTALSNRLARMQARRSQPPRSACCSPRLSEWPWIGLESTISASAETR